MTLTDLTPEEEAVIVHRGTERPFSGEDRDAAATAYFAGGCLWEWSIFCRTRTA